MVLPVLFTCCFHLSLLSHVTPVLSVDVECEVPMSDPVLRTQSDPGASGVSESVLSCHCCYDVLVNPTTLTCGHSFCRHCLAQWWELSRRTECPECREPWHGFPKVSILLRLYTHFTVSHSAHSSCSSLIFITTLCVCVKGCCGEDSPVRCEEET